ncbi:hypothetical protein ACQJBY_068835 [Aegilops geniculata]
MIKERITAGPGAVQGGGGRAGAGWVPGHGRSGGLLRRCEGAGQPPRRPLCQSCREATARWSGARSPCRRRRCWRDGDAR